MLKVAVMADLPERPPAQPTYILRGHAAQIHAVHFFRHNSRLLTADADGWAVTWNTTTKRGVAVWRAHQNTVLGLGSWGQDRLITDNKIHVWQLKLEDEAGLASTPPIDDATSERRRPWLLHSLTVNALNFCAFSACQPEGAERILIATPGVEDGHVNITVLPAEARLATIPSPGDINTGMLMATGLHILSHGYRPGRDDDDDDDSPSLLVLAGFESGHACAWRRQASGKWAVVYLSKPHTQPVLSLGVAAGLGHFFTSSADAVIARHPLSPDGGTDMQTLRTGHSGQQSLAVRSDEEIIATAGWDGRVRVYSARDLVELAVLKWHKEGCYALAFAHVTSPATEGGQLRTGGEDGTKALPSNATTVAAVPTTVSGLRTRKAESTHWIAAGSKDGKVSLWEIY